MGIYSDPSFPVQNGKERPEKREGGLSMQQSKGLKFLSGFQCPGEKGRPSLFFSLLPFFFFFFCICICICIYLCVILMCRRKLHWDQKKVSESK